MVRASSEAIEAWRNRQQGTKCRPPFQRLSPDVIADYLSHKQKLHYESSRRSGFALLCIDIDAHQGQTDALDAAQLIQAFFPGSCFEPSTRFELSTRGAGGSRSAPSTHARGYHLFLLVHVGLCPRKDFNHVAKQFERALARCLNDHNIESSIEVKGTFTTYIWRDGIEFVDTRGALAKMPRPGSIAQANALVNMPIFHVEHLRAFIDRFTGAEGISLLDDSETARADKNRKLRSSGTERLFPEHLDRNNAFHRMLFARFDFTKRHGRDPDGVDELNWHYIKLWNADAGGTERLERAHWVLDQSTFDAARATAGGYLDERDRLLGAVRESVRPEHRCNLRYLFGIDDTDLAVALWVLTRTSFAITDRPRRQFGCPNAAISGIFRKLKREGIIKRGCQNTRKLAAIKEILVRAGLISRLDEAYRFDGANPELSYAKKFGLGPNHPRYEEWLKFAKTVNVRLVRPPKEISAVSPDPTTGILRAGSDAKRRAA